MERVTRCRAGATGSLLRRIHVGLAWMQDGGETVQGLVLTPFGGKGLKPGIDLDDMGNLLDAMDKHDPTGR